MNNFRARSDNHLLPPASDVPIEDDSNLEGVAATVKLLMKLIQDHKTACNNGQNDSRRMLRVAGMMTVLENVKTRIQKCQSFGINKREAELRRCQTEPHRSNPAPRDKRPQEPVDEKEKLKRELAASLTVRKSLEAMCSSMGKEKEIMVGELTRKAHELSDMEELVNDLRAQNETLLAKVKEFSSRKNGVETTQGNVALQERNKTLSEQLLRSLEGYKSIKRKLKEANEENRVLVETMEDMGVEVGASLERIRGFKQRMLIGSENPMDEIDQEIAELENMFVCFQVKVSKHEKLKGDFIIPKGKISPCNPSVLA